MDASPLGVFTTRTIRQTGDVVRSWRIRAHCVQVHVDYVQLVPVLVLVLVPVLVPASVGAGVGSHAPA